MSKEYDVRPTEKQKKAFDNAVENGGNISKAMEQAGYSEATAKTPQKLTESKGWKELLDEHIPDELLNKKLKEGLDAIRGEDVDYPTRHKYLDTALKLRDKYPVTKTDLTSKGERIVAIPMELIEKNDTPD